MESFSKKSTNDESVSKKSTNDESVSKKSSTSRTPSQKNRRDSGDFDLSLDKESVIDLSSTEDKNSLIRGKRHRKKKVDPAYDYYN